MARKAVGAVNRADDAVLGDHAPEGAGVRACRPACPRTGPSCSRAAAARRRCRNGRRPSRRRRPPRRPRRARRRRGSSWSISARPGGRHCRAPRPSARRSCPRCRGCRAGRWRRPARTPPAAGRPRGGDRLGPVQVAAGRQRGVGLRPLQDEAALRLVAGELDRLVEQRLVGDDAARLDAAGGGEDHLRAWRRRCGSRVRCAAKPPNTTEWIAPMRAQASMAKTASGTIGM